MTLAQANAAITRLEAIFQAHGNPSEGLPEAVLKGAGTGVFAPVVGTPYLNAAEFTAYNVGNYISVKIVNLAPRPLYTPPPSAS